MAHHKLTYFFEKYLRQTNTYSRFLECLGPNNASLDAYVGRQLNIGRPPRLLLSSAFVWGLTREGHQFWQDLSDKWKELIDKIPPTRLNYLKQPTKQCTEIYLRKNNCSF